MVSLELIQLAQFIACSPTDHLVACLSKVLSILECELHRVAEVLRIQLRVLIPLHLEHLARERAHGVLERLLHAAVHLPVQGHLVLGHLQDGLHHLEDALRRLQIALSLAELFQQVHERLTRKRQAALGGVPARHHRAGHGGFIEGGRERGETLHDELAMRVLGVG